MSHALLAPPRQVSRSRLCAAAFPETTLLICYLYPQKRLLRAQCWPPAGGPPALRRVRHPFCNTQGTWRSAMRTGLLLACCGPRRAPLPSRARPSGVRRRPTPGANRRDKGEASGTAAIHAAVRPGPSLHVPNGHASTMRYRMATDTSSLKTVRLYTGRHHFPIVAAMRIIAPTVPLRHGPRFQRPRRTLSHA